MAGFAGAGEETCFGLIDGVCLVEEVEGLEGLPDVEDGSAVFASVLLGGFAGSGGFYEEVVLDIEGDEF